MYALHHGLSHVDDQLLETAWRQPVARLYAQAGLLTQKPTAMCGPTSLSLVLRSIGTEIEATRVLSGTSVGTLFGARIGGMSLDQVGEVLQFKSNRDVSLLRDLDLAALRTELRQVNDPRRRYIANFDRKPLFGWGGGHHSPIGAYLEEADALLILDVNGRVGPWLCSVPQFHRALSARDPWMDKPRGLARLTLEH